MTAQITPQLRASAITDLVLTLPTRTILLSWDTPDDDSITGYQILRRQPSEGEHALSVYVADTGSTGTSFTDTDVTTGTLHVYRGEGHQCRRREAGVQLRPGRTVRDQTNDQIDTTRTSWAARCGAAQSVELPTPPTPGPIQDTVRLNTLRTKQP